MSKGSKRIRELPSDRIPMEEQLWFVTFYPQWGKGVTELATGESGQAWQTYGFRTQEDRDKMLTDEHVMPVGTMYFLHNNEHLWVIE